ncbi:MAG: hypothetical protein D6701_08230 [Gemmatimonadetes bacterium]|nr:MAG: hypothetical protein D6701_08230 [Gemmatimonadota bacterium]
MFSKFPGPTGPQTLAVTAPPQLGEVTPTPFRPACGHRPFAGVRHGVLRRVCTGLFAAVLLVLAACSDDSTGPRPVVTQELGLVLGSVDVSLTIFPVDSPSVARTVGLGPDGTPVGLAVRGRTAAVPLGTTPALVVVDVAQGVVTRTIALPEGSGATGADFVNDSIVLVANPNLGTVTPVNVRSGSRGSDIAVGVFPTFVRTVGDQVFVVNANLENFQPAGPSSLTVIDAETLTVTSTVDLSGENAQSAAVGPDGRVYVVNAGTFFGNNGTLSVVDPGTRAEVAFHEGFGDFPGSAAFAPDGTLYVSSFSYGVASWDASARAFIRGPDDPIDPAGDGAASGVGVDGEGRLYVLEPECGAPARTRRLRADLTIEVEIGVGVCPTSVVFTLVEVG